MENQNQNNAGGQQTINVQIPSADNIASRRPLIPASFALTIIFFFFTFCDFKCGGQKIGSVTGIKLVTGTELTDHDMFTGQETKGKEVPASIWAIFAFGAAIVGLGVFIIREKREALIGTGAGAVGVGSLIILQSVVKSALDKEAGGQIEVNFQFPYWGALIALGVAGLISYLRMRQTHNVVVNISPPPPTIVEQSNESSQTQVQTVYQPIQQTGGFDIGEWFKKNNKKVIGAVATIAVLCVGYYFFLRNDPEKDGKKAAIAYCDCTEKYNGEMIKAGEGFLISFSGDGYKKRQDARNKLQELQNPLNSAYNECNNKAQNNYNELRKRHFTNEEQLKKFDFAYSSQQGLCNSSNSSKLASMYSQIENKIKTIKDPEPDIEKIKTDLIGQKIPGWNFAYLNEYQSADIINTTRGSDRIEYKIKFHLRDGATNSEHDCEVITVYLQGDQGWYFNNVRMLYITYTNAVQVGTWRSVTPLQNCNYEIIDNGQRYWVQDGSWGSKYKGGPDGDQFYLRSSQINIASREDHPIDLIFKYTPNN